MSNLNPSQFDPYTGPTSKWSGPMPGQMVMGVHDLGKEGIPTTMGKFTPDQPYETDPHGNIREERIMGTPSADMASGGENVHDLYHDYGGGMATMSRVQEHWARQPLVHIKSDTPIHTGQEHITTEIKNAGRERIDAIRESLRAGDRIKEPVWVVRQSGRLFALDGHHRVVAAREEGLPDYPARLWDRDR
jgi:hypothetical protein